MNKKQALVIAVTLILVSVIVLATFLSTDETTNPAGLKVVATFYPLAYFAEEIGGDLVEVNTLIPYNTEVHSWQPSPQDIMEVEEADIFIYNGAGLEPWVEEDLLPAINTGNKLIIDCTSGLNLLEKDNDHVDDGHDDGHDHGDEIYDPHTWIDPMMALNESRAILQAFIDADPSNASVYNANAEVLFSKFEALHQNFSDSLSTKQRDMIIVTHEAYRYLANSYDFDLEGVVGISADEQPSAATMAELATLMEDNEVYVLFTDPVYASDYADTLKATVEDRTGLEVEILPLYLMAGPSADGQDYFEQQEVNLDNLIIGLEVMP